MSRHTILEYDAKRLVHSHLSTTAFASTFMAVNVEIQEGRNSLPLWTPFLPPSSTYVCKPDMCIKRRGKSGLLLLNANAQQVTQWMGKHTGEQLVGTTKGQITRFLVEEYIPHQEDEEMYVCLQAKEEGDEVWFVKEGGMEVGNVEEKARKVNVKVTEKANVEMMERLIEGVKKEHVEKLARFIVELHKCFVDLHFCYMEINPLVVNEKGIFILDMACKLDECAKFEVGKKWGHIEFPPTFGRSLTSEEAYIADLDSKTGSSLKLTILNEKARIWTMVAGGGASVIYADTVCDLGFASELANYGEYSGDPSEYLTYEYAKTILSLMIKHPGPNKILLIGGGIANFTNVAETFKGIIKAITEFSEKLIQMGVKVFVRRGGPNYQEGLSRMRALGLTLHIPIFVYGPETHLTSIIVMALDENAPTVPEHSSFVQRESFLDEQKKLASNASRLSLLSQSPATHLGSVSILPEFLPAAPTIDDETIPKPLFTSRSRGIVYGMQPQAVQNMLDFDFICSRTTPSVAAIIYEFSASHRRKFYWGAHEIMLPVFDTLSALSRFPDVDIIVSFASSRSVYESTLEMLKFSNQIRSIAIIAEGVPERRTRILKEKAHQAGVTIIGPATVGGIKPGCFRIGNAGGMLDNIIASRLYRPGSVAYVSKSGGLSNELNNIISQCTDGVFEGVAIGGDMFPCSNFIDHVMRFENAPQVKMIVLLGEVGGRGEYDVVAALKEKKITKPIVAWCTGTIAKCFSFDIQFGHAGACASGELETADAKNKALSCAGAIVPSSFQDIHTCIASCYQQLLMDGKVIIRREPEPPKIPVDYEWARKLGLIRKGSSFVSSICDERGDELMYAGMPVSNILEQELGVGGTLGLLWFRKKLPPYAAKFIELVLILTADHGPCVSGAHNTIVATRAGKDLVSSLVSGLLTIGPRFGGALDDSALKFSTAFDKKMSPEEFVESQRKLKELIPGIGHKKKSVQNPDKRVQLIVEFVKTKFEGSTELLDYALAVEKITTKKKESLILNVDGAVACAFVDLLRGSGIFSQCEATQYISMGCLNGLFVLGRTMGLIGHHMDQKRLAQPLYRHPEEDIAYIDSLEDIM